MAGANPGVNTFQVAHNAVEKSVKNGTILVTTFHNWGHLNTDLVRNKSSVNRGICPIKLVAEVTSNFRTGTVYSRT